jgi:hypothetical protein
VKLLGASIIRDGGSLAAFFRLDDGLLGLFLERRSDQGDTRFGELRESADVQPENGISIAPGSAREAAIFAALDRWLEKPEFSPEWALSDEGRTEALDWVRRLRNGAVSRGG